MGPGIAFAFFAAAGAALIAWYTFSDSDDQHHQYGKGNGKEKREDPIRHAIDKRDTSIVHHAIPSPPISKKFNELKVTKPKSTTLKIMSYNVCSREEYPIYKRMHAISGLVELHSPQLIAFQEITLKIYTIFQSSSWWKDYHCSISKEEASDRQCYCILLSKYNLTEIMNTPLGYSKMGRLSVAKIKFGKNKSLVIASGHLKSPCPDPRDPNSQNHKFAQERKLEANEALSILKKHPNVIFCGDMNWNEKTDGQFPLPPEWIDAWNKLKGKGKGKVGKGYTFDTQSNKMLGGHQYLRKRLDRIFCNLKAKDFRVDKIAMIGKEAISDVTFKSKKKNLPVLPSDHYGLLLTVSINDNIVL